MDDTKTKTMFKKLKILLRNELHDKLFFFLHISKKDYETFNIIYKNESNNNFKFTKPKTTLGQHFYINREFKLFKIFPNNIKTIINSKLFKFTIKKLYIWLLDEFHL